MDWEELRAQFAGMFMQGILETDTNWTRKILDETFYKETAKRCVKFADALIEELKKR